MRIGLDFDNTLVCWEPVFLRFASELGWLPQGFRGSRTGLRQAIRARENGEFLWQRLQGRVYGHGMVHATAFAGALDFVTAARRCGATLFIVSHKTRHGHHDPDRIDLRAVARQWMQDRGLVDPDRAIPPDHVFFAATRAEKIARIGALNLDWFVDDLPELLSETGFPAKTRSILFSPESEGAAATGGPWILCREWAEIGCEVLGDGRVHRRIRHQ